MEGSLLERLIVLRNMNSSSLHKNIKLLDRAGVLKAMLLRDHKSDVE